MKSWIFLVLIIFSNAWIWKIAGLNLFVFLTLIFATVIFKLLFTGKLTRQLLSISLIIFGSLFLLQWQTTTSQSLILLENDEQRIKAERLQEYNPSSHYLRVIFAKLNLRNFFEGDFSTISTRLQRNFFETIDPNVYFFGGHPRERVWASDFEKFHFILFASFLIGVFKIIQQRKVFVVTYFLISLILISFIGHKNIMGPFILFPLIVICIWVGFSKYLKYET